MAKKRYVSTIFWRDKYIEKLDTSAKLLFLYFLTSPDSNIAGIYQVPISIIAVDTGLKIEIITKILERFAHDEKILYRDGWVAIKNFSKHQSTNPKVQAGIDRELKVVPEELKAWCNSLSIDYITPIIGNQNSDIGIGKGKGKGIGKVKSRPENIEEVREYLQERNITSFTAEAFLDHQETVGWIYGKNKVPIKDWKAAVRTWEQRHKNQSTQKKPQTFKERNPFLESIEHLPEDQKKKLLGMNHDC